MEKDFEFDNIHASDTEGENEEQTFDRLHYGSIPDRLWNIFPTHGKYVASILQFCGYQSREAILMLRNEDEVKNMFAFVAEHHDLIPEEDRARTLGIFAQKPHSVTLLPGLDPVMKRFIKEVEDLIPKPSLAKSGASYSSCSSNSVKSGGVAEASSKNKRMKETTSVTTLYGRMRKWLAKEIPKRTRKMSVENGMAQFLIEETSNGHFQFKCKQRGCSEIFILPVSQENFCSLSNVQRHISKSCWLSTADKIAKKEAQQSTCSRAYSPAGNWQATGTGSKMPNYMRIGSLNQGCPLPHEIDFTRLTEPPTKSVKIDQQIDSSNESSCDVPCMVLGPVVMTTSAESDNSSCTTLSSKMRELPLVIRTCKTTADTNEECI